MKIGIDFGTTRIVVAASDRGNFPLVNFETPDGEVRDWFPPTVAVQGEMRLYGWEAVARQNEPEWSVLRSLKRSLRSAGPHTQIEIDGQHLPLKLLLEETMAALHRELRERSNLGVPPDDVLEAMLGVPANANSNQRFLTEEAARIAGFEVLGLLNEPTAAALEFAHRNSGERKGRGNSGLAVYDLGGGTFDISLVAVGETEHTVIASDGIPNLGGEDFDTILANLALELSGTPASSLTSFELHQLLEECREKKESLNPNTRKLTIDLERARPGWPEVTVPVDVYYERCRPLIESTRKVVEDLLESQPQYPLDTLYVTGGGSELPPVARVLKETFGRRVKRSAYMRSASAVGLAIRASTQAERLNEQFTENFGLWRESDDGRNITFDLIFPRGAKLPSPGEPPLHRMRAYQPAHNIGHFRYLECTHLDPEGQPTGEITKWDEILFPFDRHLQRETDLAAQTVERFAAPQGFMVKEDYTCDASGNLQVTVSTESTGYVREYRIGSWSNGNESNGKR
ncbi:Chaperone protein DnaK [Acidisarcina polymorpha]|uniref:Chaperone protein DnaK n=1 Tax=Acidisarcina polymorpha TaxID=2211140 RepID=A0A2Z5G7Z3_9BACT|nr:Hsp70 family protein [Acidisarcina polymorpha]AXC15108.1 Chaperone protein DnaK [Acidisarcina polymorpha]